MATKSAKKKRMPAKRRTRPEKAEDHAAKEYADKYQAWNDEACNILAAKQLMELAGGYKEAFILLDVLRSAAFRATKAAVQEPEGMADDFVQEYGEKIEACVETARKVLAANQLLQLVGEEDESLLLLDAVMIAVEGEQGHEQAAEVYSSAARNQGVLAAAAQKER